MSKITKIIFNGADHKLTSPFGARAPISTKAGVTTSFHSGADYGTGGKKIPQYAVGNGYVFAAQKASDGAKYVWIVYPGIKKAMLHYHLDSYCVRTGVTVKNGTQIGITGMTGKATGIHLHLGIRDLSKLSDLDINSMTWGKLQSCPYIDPEEYAKVFGTEKAVTNTSYLPGRGYFRKGDVSETVGKIAKFMFATFPAYTPREALGNTYGPNIIGAIEEFQRRTGLEADGYCGPITLNMLIKYGLKL